jgi:hypothetical protein
LWWPFWKWRSVEIVQCRESIRDIIIYPHSKLWWYRTRLNLLNNFYRSQFSKCITKIQHCPISSQFDMWVDNDVPNWFPTLNNIFAVLWWPFWKWRPVEIVQCRESIRDIIIYPHSKFWLYRTMLNFWWPPQYHKNSTLSDIITIWYVGR